MFLVRWNPFDITSSFEGEFNDMVIRFLAPSFRAVQTMGSRPAMEVFRDGDELVVRVELPGIDPKRDVEVSVEDNVLRIKGHREIERAVSEEKRHLVERAIGEFHRDVVLPDAVDPDQVNADYEAGILTVTVRLAESLDAPEPKRIPVTISKLKNLIGGRKKKAA